MTTLTTIDGNRVNLESPKPIETFRELYPGIEVTGETMDLETNFEPNE